MTTTDRMSDLNSRREVTDRVGQTVVLGNSVEGAALSAIATVVAGAAGESRASVDMLLPVSANINWGNGSFGIWSTFLDIDSSSLLKLSGSSIASSRFNQITAGLLSWGADAMLLNIRVITSTQAYTPTSGTAAIVVLALGAGGGGGGCAATGGGSAAAGGGGAGALAMGRITSSFSGATVTIGAAGAGGAAGQNNGSAGGNTSFGSVLIGGGGSGGVGGPASAIPTASSGGVGGAASGSSSLFGSRGETGSQGFGITTNASITGKGGSSPYGSGGIMNVTATSSPGDDANGFGAGGGGAANVGVQSAQAGGDGSPGLCIIYEYNA